MLRLMVLILAGFLSSCSVGKSSFSPNKKYTRQQLEKDYTVYQNVLEHHHPGLYWYTGKDSMDYYFRLGQQRIKDSMTEPEFRILLSYISSKINCGHTSVRGSKNWFKYADTLKSVKLFPLSLKIWNDTMVVSTNLNRKDSVLKRGTEILKINDKKVSEIADTLFEFISTDGYNRTHKYQSLSNRGFFGSIYSSVFGLRDKYSIEYVDSAGRIKKIEIPVYNAAADTAGRTGTRRFRETQQPTKKEIKEQQINAVRLLKIDSVNKTAMMSLSSFGRSFGLRKFFRNSFRVLQKNKIGHLIIDVRSNGGGSVSNSTIITRYLAKQPFKISDSLYAVRTGSPYQRYIKNHFWNKLFITLFTRKKNDGKHHFGYFERHHFSPKKNHHYDGKVYILTGGNSFSATTLFVSALIRQENVVVVGEETGGGAYGNSAWLIPDFTLPETGVRIRLPLFRLVLDKNAVKTGKGVQPEIKVTPTIEAIKRNKDFKLDKALELINIDKEEKKTRVFPASN